MASSTGVVDIVDMNRENLNVLCRSIGAHGLRIRWLEKSDSRGMKLRICPRLQPLTRLCLVTGLPITYSQGAPDASPAWFGTWQKTLVQALRVLLNLACVMYGVSLRIGYSNEKKERKKCTISLIFDIYNCKNVRYYKSTTMYHPLLHGVS